MFIWIIMNFILNEEEVKLRGKAPHELVSFRQIVYNMKIWTLLQTPVKE